MASDATDAVPDTPRATDAGDKSAMIDRIAAFLISIGIDAREGEIGETTFLPGIRIDHGAIIFDKERLLYPGDLLHEAGHVAVCAESERMSLFGDIGTGDKGVSGEEIVAQLWSYAACLEMGIAPEVVFHETGYKGASAWILSNYRRGDYIGLPLLVWMGLAAPRDEPGGFPAMRKWLRS